MLVEEGPPDVGVFVAEVGRSLDAPYRAEAIRRDERLWAVGARRIEVVALPDVRGDELELVSHDHERTLIVDGDRSLRTIESLERPEHVVRAHRLEGESWEVEVDPLWRRRSAGALVGLCYSRRWKRASWSRSTGWWQVRQRPAQQRRTGCRSSTACGSVRPAAGLAGAGVPR